jgi:regulator of nucleoside diphosphate kinase
VAIKEQTHTPAALVAGVLFLLKEKTMIAKLHLLLNELDHARLERLVDSTEYSKMPVAQALAERLDNADIAAPDEIPADLVSMHSRVRFRDL